MIGRKSALEQLTGPPVEAARDDRSWVYIQSDARTLFHCWGLAHLVALPARTHFLSATYVHMWSGPRQYPHTVQLAPSRVSA
ncbi:hypothetical protein RW1_038_00390 [Rhodococcus wratislaviensis NBRC 100605]|uniref:Uncharacterized protein n=1 Tax=Rhodococcus wratislaviensis NBRC 100605 TaxID=1219028 RepID=X0PV94_RHOWR|nr:hypothetical protein RW1_038_00390 [Rhodococcus wratislaviensis NBRC 100605]